MFEFLLKLINFISSFIITFGPFGLILFITSAFAIISDTIADIIKTQPEINFLMTQKLGETGMTALLRLLGLFTTMNELLINLKNLISETIYFVYENLSFDYEIFKRFLTNWILYFLLKLKN